MEFTTYRTEYAVRQPISIGPLHRWRNGFYVSIGCRVVAVLFERKRRALEEERRQAEDEAYHARMQRLIRLLDSELPPKAVEGSGVSVGQ